MKKYLGVFVIAALVMALFTGCTDTPVVEDDPTGLADGTWIGHTEADLDDAYGSIGIVGLTVENGEITAVDYSEHQVSSAEAKTEDYPWPQYFEAIDEATQILLETQGVEDIDVYAEATGTTNMFIEATKTALDNSTTENAYYNGTYYAKLDVDEHGYYAVGFVTFDNDVITHVKYEERLAEDNKAKDETYGLSEYLEAVDSLTQELMDKQNLEGIDVYAGATQTSDNFLEVMENIFNQASAK